MRLTSEFVVSALVRRVEGEGAYATIARRGDDTAGAIFVLVDGLEGVVTLYGPASAMAEDQRPSMDAALTGNRLFSVVALAEPSREEADKALAREMRFDPDLWIVDIEDRRMRNFLPVVDS